MPRIEQQVGLPSDEALLYVGPDGQLIVDQGNHGLRVQDGVSPGGNLLLSANSNLADLVDVVKARANLGLGSAALLDADAGFMLGANNLEEITNPEVCRVNIEAAALGANEDINSILLNAFGLVFWNVGKTFKTTVQRMGALTADRNFIWQLPDGNVTLELTDDATIEGTNTGDQALSGDVTGAVANPIVTTIAALAVDTGKLADAAVATGKIVDNAVTTAKIADANVTGAKLENYGIGPTVINFTAAGGTISLDAHGRVTSFIAN